MRGGGVNDSRRGTRMLEPNSSIRGITPCLECDDQSEKDKNNAHKASALVG